MRKLRYILIPLILILTAIFPIIANHLVDSIVSSHSCTLDANGDYNPCMSGGTDISPFLQPFKSFEWFCFLSVPFAFGLGILWIIAEVMFRFKKQG